MKILSIVISIFILLEAINVAILYFKPGCKLGNGIGVFDGWEKSKSDPQMHSFIKYLVYWVAGTKLIFIVLLLVILFTGSHITKFLSVISLILSILSFYWKLYPIIKRLDNNDEISPKGYSRGLGLMIGTFISMFSLAIILEFIL